MTRSVCLAIGLFGFVVSSSGGWAQEITYSDGTRTISINESMQNVTYASGSGSVTTTVQPSGLFIGSDGVLVTELPASGANRELLVTVVQGGSEVSGVVQVDEEGALLPDQDLGALTAALGSFAATAQGQLLLEANVTLMPNIPGDQLDGWSGCVGDLLNAVAAGAAMVGGCGTPACGLAYRYCCGSGIAWYASSLISMASSCRIASW